MTYCEPARTTRSWIPKTLIAGLLVLIAAIAAALGPQSPASMASTAASPVEGVWSEPRGAPSSPAGAPAEGRGSEQRGPLWSPTGAPVEGLRSEQRGGLTEVDGALPDGATVFDDQYPGVAKFDPHLLQALRHAATDAADVGVELYVNSGWRSAKYQDQLFREAVSKYGSEQEAARWVATADTSAHVSGNAVDIGSSAALAWLSKHGAEYGLCQIYRNEPWHYELRADAIDRGCPPMYADLRDPEIQH